MRAPHSCGKTQGRTSTGEPPRPPLRGGADAGGASAALQQRLSQAPTLSMWQDDDEGEKEEEGRQDVRGLVSLLAASGAAGRARPSHHHHDGIATPRQHGPLGLLPGPPSSASSGDSPNL